MLCVAFIEPSGSLISNPSEPWRDETKEARDQPARTGAAGGVGNDALSSDDQYTVMVSEKQARVVSLPSQTCLYRVNLAPAEGAFAVTANVVSLKGDPHSFHYFSSIFSKRLYCFAGSRWSVFGHVLIQWPYPSLQLAQPSTADGCRVHSVGRAEVFLHLFID
jgi:hypothetical protein